MFTTPDSFDISYARRRFLFNSACSVGTLALTSLLKQDGLLAADPATSA